MASSPPFSARTSGDILADRRYAYGDAAYAEQDWAAALDLFAQVVELAPGWAPAHFALAKAAIRLGEDQRAGEALHAVLALDPADHLGASLLLAQIGRLPTVEAMPHAYIAALFDDYAPRFDAHLVQQLEYRAPEMLVAALDRHASGRHFEHVLDLGCGTGLMARALGPRAGQIIGVDLSPRMLGLAREAGLYAGLHQGDLIKFLNGQPEKGTDLVIAADVFCYLPDLQPVLAASARCLVAKGLLAFTIQTHAGEGVLVGEDCRMHHSQSLVRTLADQMGYRRVTEEEAISRHDAGKRVPGALFLLATA